MISTQTAKDAAAEGKRLIDAHKDIIHEVVREMRFGTSSLTDAQFIAWWAANRDFHRYEEKLEVDVDGTVTGIPGQQYPVRVDHGPMVWEIALRATESGREDVRRYERIMGNADTRI